MQAGPAWQISLYLPSVSVPIYGEKGLIRYGCSPHRERDTVNLVISYSGNFMLKFCSVDWDMVLLQVVCGQTVTDGLCLRHST